MSQTQQPNVVPPDDQSLFSTLTSLQTSNPAAYNAIVRPNNPPLGIGGFLFDIPGDEEIRLRSQITNYFLENNTSVQDNIALEPATITLRGMVAELTLGLLPATSAPTPAPTTTNPLIPAMQPGQTPQQQQNALIASISKASLAAQGATSLYTYFQNYESFGPSGPPVPMSRQTTAFLFFQQMWAGQQLCSVETPWGIYENCAILEIRVIQDAKTKYASDFTVTFQEMRFAGDATVQTGNQAGRTALQSSPTAQNGNAGQTQVAQAAIIAALPFTAAPPPSGPGP